MAPRDKQPKKLQKAPSKPAKAAKPKPAPKKAPAPAKKPVPAKKAARPPAPAKKAVPAKAASPKAAPAPAPKKGAAPAKAAAPPAKAGRTKGVSLPPPPIDPTLEKPLLTRRATSLPLKLKARALAQKGKPEKRISTPPAPPPPPPKPKTLEERMHLAERRLTQAPDDFRKAYVERLHMSWIHHDAALEGTFYTRDELEFALNPSLPLPATESNIEPICEEIRRHKEAIDWVRDQAINHKKAPITIDTIRKLFLILHPEEGELKLVRYRRDVPQHRLYFHEYTTPDKVPAKVRGIVDWVNDPETKKTRSALRLAARAHYDLLRVFPFQTDSGKVSRLFMNLLLMRAGLLPAIIHAADRQKYYEALKGSPATVNQLVFEALENALSSVEKLLDEHETKTRSFV